MCDPFSLSLIHICFFRYPVHLRNTPFPRVLVDHQERCTRQIKRFRQVSAADRKLVLEAGKIARFRVVYVLSLIHI